MTITGISEEKIVIKPEQSLKMSTASALQKLNAWSEQYQTANGLHLKISYDKNMQIGEGEAHYVNNAPTNITLGIHPLSISFPEKYFHIDDANFVMLGVVLFHEFKHCDRLISHNTPREILMSDLSKCYNETYYYAEHHKLPHEIDAEYNGVMSMWSALESEWPDSADRLMIGYLNYRTESSDCTKKLYMIERPVDGFRSKQQVRELFEEAYEKSLAEKRELPSGFISYDGDTSRLLATDDGRGVRTEYATVYRKLSNVKTGAGHDQMMASLISYVHPELMNQYAGIDFEELDPDDVFSLLMPETIDEARTRLGYEDSFAKGIDYVTGLQNKEQEL